jgi:hypothetical protein
MTFRIAKSQIFDSRMKRNLLTEITTQNGKSEFQLRFFVDEGVGLLTTRDGENYLLPNAIDRWYDLTQKTYPKKRICSCKSDFFELGYCNENRVVQSGQVDVIAICSNCQKERKITSVTIECLKNDELLSFCKQPRLKYKVTQLTSYWSVKDLEFFLKFITDSLKMTVYCWNADHSDKNKCFERVDISQASNMISNHTGLNFYFSEKELDLTNFRGIYTSDKDSPMLDREPWRKLELISLSAPLYMYGYGLVYFIEYCQRYISNGILRTKSNRFERKTGLLRAWLKDNFIGKRGSNCYDGKEAFDKFIEESSC